MSSNSNQVKIKKDRTSDVVSNKICGKLISSTDELTVCGFNTNLDEKSNKEFLEVLDASHFVDVHLNTNNEDCPEICINDLTLGAKQDELLLPEIKVIEPSKKKMRTDPPSIPIKGPFTTQPTRFILATDSSPSTSTVTVDSLTNEVKNCAVPIKIITSMSKTAFVPSTTKTTKAPQRIILTQEQLQQLNLLSPTKTVTQSQTKLIPQSSIRRSIPITIAPKAAKIPDGMELPPGVVKVLTPIPSIAQSQQKNLKFKIETSNANTSPYPAKIVLKSVSQANPTITIQKLNPADVLPTSFVNTSLSNNVKASTVGIQNQVIKLLMGTAPQRGIADTSVTNVIPLSPQKTIAPKPIIGSVVKPIAPAITLTSSPIKVEQIPFLSNVQPIMVSRSNEQVISLMSPYYSQSSNNRTQLKQKIIFPAPNSLKHPMASPNNNILMVPLVGQSSLVKTSTSSSPVPEKTVNLSKLSRCENNGIRSRKPCNCAKSQCLKLYCECFANGEFCNNCNCKSCYNNLEHERERQEAIELCLERNLNAFKPKIGKGSGDSTQRRHTKGCNCKKSGCLKNYCECYEARISCTDQCKCVGCRNCDAPESPNSLMQLAQAAEVHGKECDPIKSKSSSSIIQTKYHHHPFAFPGSRDFLKHFTKDVIDTACNCLLVRAKECSDCDAATLERNILLEFNAIIKKIIDPNQ